MIACDVINAELACIVTGNVKKFVIVGLAKFVLLSIKYSALL